MARASGQSLGWALLTTACLGLAFLATVGKPRLEPSLLPPRTPTSQVSLHPSSPTTSVKTTQPAMVKGNTTKNIRHQLTAVSASHASFHTPVATPLSTTTTTPRSPVATSTTTTTTTTTTQPVVAFATVAPHGVGFVAQPLAARATYTVTAERGGTVTIRNESTAPLLVTVDHDQAITLDAAKACTLELESGEHQLALSATAATSQTYVIDGSKVAW